MNRQSQDSHFLSRFQRFFFPGKKRKIPPPSGHKLGTFIGVFTPTILTILGVILYLRFGWVVGQVGVLKTLLIVVLANSITLVTAFCLSAVATNSRVGVGGAYFIISRSLGLEIGAAIGLPLYLFQTLSVTLYAFGLAKSLRQVWPHALIFVSNIEKRLDLVRYGTWFCENRGVVTVSELVQGDLLSLDLDIDRRETEINRILSHEGMLAFGEVNVVQDVERGIIAVAQANGMVGIKSNTVMLGWPDAPEDDHPLPETEKQNLS